MSNTTIRWDGLWLIGLRSVSLKLWFRTHLLSRLLNEATVAKEAFCTYCCLVLTNILPPRDPSGPYLHRCTSADEDCLFRPSFSLGHRWLTWLRKMVHLFLLGADLTHSQSQWVIVRTLCLLKVKRVVHVRTSLRYNYRPLLLGTALDIYDVAYQGTNS